MARIGFAPFLLLIVAPGAYGQTSEFDTDLDPAAAIRAVAPRIERPQRSARSLVSSTTSLSTIVSLNYDLGHRHSVGVSTEFVKVSSFYFRYRGFEQYPEWKFKGVPITLKYEHALRDRANTIVPVVGLGVSYYLTQLKQRATDTAYAGTMAASQEQVMTRKLGMGWGAQATAGLRARLSGSVFLEVQGRYRLIDSLGIMGPDSFDSRFGVFDFAVGFGFEL